VSAGCEAAPAPGIFGGVPFAPRWTGQRPLRRSAVSTLTVVACSESFASLWPELAEALGCALAVVGASDAAEATGAAEVLVAAGGVEEEAEPLLRALAAAGAPAPVVVGARADHRFAASLVRSGAADYFALPADVEALRAEFAERGRQRLARSAAGTLAADDRGAYDFGRIIGRSPRLLSALDRASRIIRHGSATVLITGETGTGKELLAHAIHFNGPRAAGPLVELNCNAIPPQLLESELFGHEKGAFTDARTAKPGLFEAADGGTLFLDEIGDLPLALQGKILKALEEKQVRRVGAVRPRTVDVRIIAATHVDLTRAVAQGEFREDLFYRLSVIPIHLPPLRDRGDDVLLLASHFLSTLAEQYGIPAPPLDPELRRTLLSHAWPGNVRELRNAVERALLLADGPVRAGDLFHGRAVPPRGDGGGDLPFPARMDDIERAAARAMLARTGNKSAAAEALGISRSRLYRLLAEEDGGGAE
jgi:DNA-binding NtrC family response regulator